MVFNGGAVRNTGHITTWFFHCRDKLCLYRIRYSRKNNWNLFGCRKHCLSRWCRYRNNDIWFVTNKLTGNLSCCGNIALRRLKSENHVLTVFISLLSKNIFNTLPHRIKCRMGNNLCDFHFHFVCCKRK